MEPNSGFDHSSSEHGGRAHGGSAHGGSDLRPLTRDRASDWAKLLAVIARADGDDEVFGEEDLIEDFDDPRRDFPLGSVAAYDGEAMIGYSVLDLGKLMTGRPSIRQEGGVHPDYRGRGLGSELIAWSERAARTIHEQRQAALPLVLSGQCLQKNATAMALYADKGYEQARWFQLMECGFTTDLSLPPAAGDFTITGFTPARSEDARLVRNEAFRDHWESTDMSADEWEHYNAMRAFRSAYSFVCYLAAEPVGMIVSSEYEVFNETIGRRDLYISMVGTTRAARGRGVGTALLTTAIAAAKADGFESASLHVDADSPTGAVGVYERLGFTVTHTSVAQRKELIGTS